MINYCRCDTADDKGRRSECGRPGVQCETCKLKDKVAEQAAEIERLREAGNKLLAAVDDYVQYTHNGDPWQEDARVMNEMDIDELNNNGELDKIREVFKQCAK